MAVTKKERQEIIDEAAREAVLSLKLNIEVYMDSIMNNWNMPITIGIKLLDPEAQLPVKANETDACWDIHALQTMQIASQRTAGIRTGFSLDIPEGYMVELRPRSGLAFQRGVTIQNSPATIDAGYKDEIIVIMHNHNVSMPYIANAGDRIAQMRLVKLTSMQLKEKTKHGVADRKGGLGSTGK